MPYSHVTRTANGVAAIQYIRGMDGKGHNGAEVRNEYISGVNMLPDSVVPFEQQMQVYWNKARSNHTTQIDRFIISFSPKELDADNPADVLRGHQTAVEMAREMFPGHQVMVATQTDGKGHKVHCHLAVNDVNMETCKGLDSIKYAHFHFSKEVDRICERCLDLDHTELAAEKETRAVRGKKLKNEKIKAQNAQEVKAAQEEGRAPVLRPQEYIWMEDLKARIRDAAAQATDEDTFFSELRSRGVEVERKKATKKQPEHYLYELTDVSGFTGKIPANLRSKSFKMGANYQPEGVVQYFKAATIQSVKQTAQQTTVQAAQKPVQPAPAPRPVTVLQTPEKPVQAPQSVQEQPNEKPPEKSPEEIKKEREQAELKLAKDNAKAYIMPVMRRVMGWEEYPQMTAPDGEKITDWEQVGKQMQQGDKTFSDFEKWRVQRRKDGQKLPEIYTKDKYGTVFVERTELEKQFSEFMDRTLHPDKYKQQTAQKPAQETPTPAPAPRQHKAAEQPQKAAAATPKPATVTEADRQRQQAAARRAALMADLERKTAAIEEKARQQREEQKTGWGRYG